MTMNTRPWGLALIAILASCGANEDAGVVLNVDTDVTADRAAINRLVVAVEGKPQEWNITRPLPGSLSFTTSAGTRFVTVDGFANTVRLGHWNGMVNATKGSVVVQDVHLAALSKQDAGVPDSRVADAQAMDTMADGTPADRSADLALDRGSDSADARGDSADAPLLPPVDAGVDAAPADAFRPDASTPDSSVMADVGQPNADATDALPATLAGAFAVHSLFDTSASAASPGPVRNALTLMHSFVDDPGAAILAFADQAGVPAATTLRATLPNALMNGLTGWMNTYIKSAGSNGVVPYDRLVWLDDTVRTLLLYWNLDSRLALPAGPGTHTPRVLGFTVTSGSPVLYAIDPTLLTPATNVTAALSWPDATPPLVTLSDHAFALPFGRYAAPALDAILLAKYGTPTLAAYLSDSVGCAGLAESVAGQCIGVVCFGHASEVTALCEGGLAEGARQIDAQIQAIDLKAVRFQRGTATVVSSEGANPQPLAALKNGVWTVTVDFGNGPEPANATFSAGPETTSRF